MVCYFTKISRKKIESTSFLTRQKKSKRRAKPKKKKKKKKTNTAFRFAKPVSKTDY